MTGGNTNHYTTADLAACDGSITDTQSAAPNPRQPEPAPSAPPRSSPHPLALLRQASVRSDRSIGAKAIVNGPRGVTVSTLDSESSDRGSTPREALNHCHDSKSVPPVPFSIVCCQNRAAVSE